MGALQVSARACARHARMVCVTVQARRVERCAHVTTRSACCGLQSAPI